jgi:hypothetical protein
MRYGLLAKRLSTELLNGSFQDSFRKFRIPQFLQSLLILLIPHKETTLSKSTTLNIDCADTRGRQGKLIHFFYLAASPLEAAL